jgi:ABC-2 type transport system ATP-binding protein
MSEASLPHLSAVVVAERANATDAIVAHDLRFSYGAHEVLRGVSFSISKGEIFCFLGPNGSGKTTLFKLLSTLATPPRGTLSVLGQDLREASRGLRRSLGVVFQKPAIDTKLTVLENLRCHGYLYGLHGLRLQERAQAMVELLDLRQYATARVHTLSGGFQRRVELAKALLHEPEILVLDEPSSGLDPGARRDFFNYLLKLRASRGVTVVLTTHHMDEAERCDRVAVLHHGRMVAVAPAAELKQRIGGDVVVVRGAHPEMLWQRLKQRLACPVALIDGTLRLEAPRGYLLVAQIVEAFGEEIESVSFGKPTLEDVFVQLTGQRFFGAGAETDQP